MYMTIREVVATKQNTDTNITQPWIRGKGTREEAIRIHTRPPKICRKETERECVLEQGKAQVTKGLKP